MDKESLISLRKATYDDLEFFFKLRNDPVVRNISFNSDEITLEKHSSWYIKKIGDSNSHLFVVLSNNGDRVGQTRVDVEGNSGVMSIAIVEKYRGQGYGRTAIQQTSMQVLSDDPRIDKIFAYIRLDNSASLKAFMKAGFSQEDVSEINGIKCHKTVLRKNEYLLGELSDMNYIPPFPKVLRIEPASACNFKCVHCPTGLGMNPDVGLMSLDDFNKIFENIKNRHFRVISMFFGGESFLNKNFFEMARKLRPLTDRIELNSNGSLLSEKLIDRILAENIIDRISFSIDGTSAEENNKIRIGANFEKISGNIKKLIIARNKLGLKKPRIFIANTQIPETVSDVGEIRVPEFLLNAFKEVESDISYECTYSLIWAGMAIQPGSNKPNNNFCDHAVNTITIRANGDVVPCCYDITTMMPMGNALKQSLEDIWQSKKFAGLRKGIAEFKPPRLCHGCEVLYPKAIMTKKDIKIK